MAGIIGLLLVSASVGLSNFAGAIGIGLGGIDASTRLRVGITFGVFEAMMPIAGLLAGQAVSGYFGHVARYVGGGILAATGAYTLWQGRRTARRPHGEAELSVHHLLVTGLALSVDNLAVGFALAIYRVPIVLAAATMGVISVAMSLVGLELGHRLGARVEAWSDELGGAVLIGVGIAIATGLLG
jgi:putative Mn2+ efflux pump MntP